MSTASNPQSVPVPRFRLSTLFIFFTCAAIGLATTRDLLAAPWAAIKVAMVIGLLQQTRELLRWFPENGSSAGVWHARTFAIVWRLVVAAAMVFFLVVELTGWSVALLYPDREDLFFYEPTTVIADLLPIVVLANSVRRWRPSVAVAPSRHVGWSIAAAVLLLLAARDVIDARLTEFLVHRATAGIEASITPGFQRPGAYPDHASEGFRSFWIAFAAAAMVPLGAAFLIGASKRWKSIGGMASSAAFVFCLAAQLVYCRWYYSNEYHRVSPDLAGAGLAAESSDLLTIAILLALISIPAAYFLAASRKERTVIATNLAVDLEGRAIHESTPCLSVICLSAVVSLVYVIAGTLHEVFFPMMPTSHLNAWMQLWLNTNMLFSPLMLLVVAPSLLGLQLGYVRWKRRREVVPWELPALPGAAIAWNWLAVAAAILIGVPTLAAFGFMFWLGPFNFSGL